MSRLCRHVRTWAVFSVDDDIRIEAWAVLGAFEAWLQDTSRMVGFVLTARGGMLRTGLIRGVLYQLSAAVLSNVSWYAATSVLSSLVGDSIRRSFSLRITSELFVFSYFAEAKRLKERYNLPLNLWEVANSEDEEADDTADVDANDEDELNDIVDDERILQVCIGCGSVPELLRLFRAVLDYYVVIHS